MTYSAGDDAARVVEAYVKIWLRESELGKGLMGDTRLPLDEAVDSVFELLNRGFLKLQTDGQNFIGIRFCPYPKPPIARIDRPKTRLQ